MKLVDEYNLTHRWKAFAFYTCSERYLDANLKGEVQDLATAISFTREALNEEARCRVANASKFVGPPFGVPGLICASEEETHWNEESTWHAESDISRSRW